MNFLINILNESVTISFVLYDVCYYNIFIFENVEHILLKCWNRWKLLKLLFKNVHHPLLHELGRIANIFSGVQGWYKGGRL
jgi:hypothetical protein